jgi:hypothetical protein
MRGQIHVPAALLGTCLRGGAVDPTAVLIFSCLATPPYCRPTVAPSYAILGNCRVGFEQRKAGLGLSNLRQGLGLSN